MISFFKNRKKETNTHLLRIFLVLICIILMYIVWEMYIDDFPVREEMIIEAGKADNMSVPFPEISGLAVSLEDIEGGYTNEKYAASLALSIEEKNGEKIWEADCGEVELTTFAFTEIADLPNMPLQLDGSKDYIIKCYFGGEEIQNVSYAVFGGDRTIGGVYLACCVAAVVLLCLLLWWSQIKISFCWKFAVAGILLGMLYNITFIPLSVPDEVYHFGQVYANSNRILGKEIYDESGRIFISDSGILRLELCQYSSGQGVYRFWNNWEYGNNHEEAVSTRFVYSSYLKQYVYVPAAVIVSLARMVGMPYQIVFLSGRMANLVFYLLLMVLSMKLYPKLQRSIAAISFLPSTVWLAASYSSDSWNLSLCILFFIYCMYCKDRQSKIGWRDVAILCIICAILAPIKIVYVLIGVSILFVPKEKFKNIYYQIITYILILLSGTTVFITGRGSAAVSYATTQAQDVRSVVVDREGYTISWVLHNPIHTIKVYINTLIERGERYIYTAIGGDFLYYEISSLLIYAILFVFLLIVANELNNSKPTILERITASGIFVLGAAAVLTAFLFSYSVIYLESIGTISGVQGRYFLPFFILLPIILQSRSIRIEGREITLLKGMVVMNAVCVWCNFVRLIH